MPKVSVIIPNYNHARFLPKRIESVLLQSYTDIEVIILDDCSPDNSREIIEAYAAKDERIRLHFNEVNSGSTFVQWNRGVELARGEYIWIAESDDFASTDLLESLVPVLEKNEDVVLAYGQTVVVDESGDRIRSYQQDYDFLFKGKSDRWKSDFIVDGKSEASEFLIFHNTIPNASAALIRKSSYLKTGGAEPKWKLNGDWMFYAKLLMNGKLAFVNSEVNFFRTHPVTQRQTANLTPRVYDEILHILRFIRENGHPTSKNIWKAHRIVAAWWTGSLFRQKWTLKTASVNFRLFWQFLLWKPWLPLSLVLTLFFYILSNLTTWLGIKGKLRKWINRVIPGLLFDPEEKEIE
ncbi:glycosyltransferase family 2 protein [Phaeocystidibacter luteus]|uniref:glycosyltransferase family 2 protein n=1 Tax=Phaeocystidibacter luteus TaxID=911197 RepID=UPI0014786CFD|nr:glycosyltransferase family 2 protein [Phaeocystidibacter luteus]